MTTLTKHHGLGNDFLVAFHPGIDDLASFARRVCQRTTGVGADGLLVGESEPGHSARMVLYNADGSRAEMSGNGIRCFAQALARTARRSRAADDPHRRRPPPGRVAGRRRTRAPSSPRVDLGTVSELPEPDGWAAVGAHPDRPVAHLGLGNPHTVVGVDDVHAVDLLALGTQFPTGQPGDHRAGARARRHHDARPRARRRHHPGVRHRRRGGGLGRGPLGARRARGHGTGRAHGRRERESGAPPTRGRPCHVDRSGHLRRHDRGT